MPLLKLKRFKMKKNILFICKYNRFRSRVAESIFNKLNKNKDYQVKSAGIIGGAPIDVLERDICKKQEINIGGTPQGLSTSLLRWQDVTIVVADDVPISIFKDNKRYGKELITWSILDNKNCNKKEILDIVELINKKVKKYIKGLK